MWRFRWLFRWKVDLYHQIWIRYQTWYNFNLISKYLVYTHVYPYSRFPFEYWKSEISPFKANDLAFHIQRTDIAFTRYLILNTIDVSFIDAEGINFGKTLVTLFSFLANHVAWRRRLILAPPFLLLASRRSATCCPVFTSLYFRVGPIPRRYSRYTRPGFARKKGNILVLCDLNIHVYAL